MSYLTYNYRVQANITFDESKVYNPAVDNSLRRFSLVIWYGKDDEGWVVFKKDPNNGDIVRIDFLPPFYSNYY